MYVCILRNLNMIMWNQNCKYVKSVSVPYIYSVIQLKVNFSIIHVSMFIYSLKSQYILVVAEGSN